MIYIVRHGESEGNFISDQKKAFDSDLEISSGLTKKGRKQIETLAGELSHIQFEAIFSSDYTRAQETAEILKGERVLVTKSTKEIRERQLGSWAGKWHLVKHQLQEEIKKLSEEDKMKFVFEDVETEENLLLRFTSFLGEIVPSYSGKTILVVSHSNMMRAFLVKLGYARYHELPPGSIDNAGYYVLESDGLKFSLKEVYGVKKTESII